MGTEKFDFQIKGYPNYDQNGHQEPVNWPSHRAFNESMHSLDNPCHLSSLPYSGNCIAHALRTAPGQLDGLRMRVSFWFQLLPHHYAARCGG
jgi:hypothetical protein